MAGDLELIDTSRFTKATIRGNSQGRQLDIPRGWNMQTTNTSTREISLCIQADMLLGSTQAQEKNKHSPFSVSSVPLLTSFLLKAGPEHLYLARVAINRK